MKKCPYCTPQENNMGNFPEAALFCDSIRIGKMEIDCCTPFISLTHNGAYLALNLFDEDHHIRINYCPVCGRNLNEYIKELEVL